ncbi:MAG: tryptophan--tRNA ligase [Rickettsiaceae bacterium]|nr:MAG: tryptophan--tRNA ligase [Rickettsiaceae bacterium]
MKKTVISGVQTTGTLHLGNYLGAIKNWVKMQQDHNCLFFLASMHAITANHDAQDLRSSTMSAAAIYLAAGLDPNQSTIFLQHSVKEHAELAWIFNCVTPIGQLKRMTQFKDKAGKDQENICLGLFSYPVLMAADILLYQAELVPVGEDQKQHLELTRDIAGIINRKFGYEVFKIPLPLINDTNSRVMSLDNGSKKMSKSNPSDLSRINLIDSTDQIVNKIKKAKTDSINEISYDPTERPEISNLLDIFSLLSDQSIEDVTNKYNNKNFSLFKQDLAAIIDAELSPIRSKYQDLMHHPDYINQVLKQGADKARKIATVTLDQVKNLFGWLDIG